MDRLSERAQEERRRRGWLDAAFEMADRDLEVGGGIIAGALAYRLFIWLLPAGLVFVGGIGVVADALSDTPKQIGSNLGIGSIVSSSLQSAAHSRSPWYALIVGVPLLLYATRSVLRVLIGTHRLAWGDVRDARPKPTYVDAAKLLGILITIWYMVCAVSGPVWEEFREAEKEEKLPWRRWRRPKRPSPSRKPEGRPAGYARWDCGAADDIFLVFFFFCRVPTTRPDPTEATRTAAPAVTSAQSTCQPEWWHGAAQFL